MSLLLLVCQGAAVGGPEFWVSSWQGQGHRVLLLLPSFCGQGHHQKLGGACVVCFSLEATGILGAVGVSATTEGLRMAGTPSSVPLVSLPCVSVHPPSSVQTCEISSILEALGRITFVELWIFYWLQMEKERQREQLKPSLF